VSIANTPGYATDSVEEHAIALILAVAKAIPLAHCAMQKRPFHVNENNRDHERFCGLELRGKTLGIIGLGAIGRWVAEIGAGLGMRVIAYNRSPVLCDKVEPMSLDDMLKVSDVVSIHLALNMQTKNFISGREFALMKPGAILINTADPGHVDSAALYRAVAEKRIWGVGLDGMTDDGDQSLLLAMDNIVMSPLSASWTREALRKRADAIVASVEDYVKGCPINIVG
jgi:phosphoglycerate dehydrogenase-like enzyme